MSGFSASDAALEGFQVIRARWRVVAGWCLFSVMGFVALLVLAFLAIAAATLGAASQAQAGRVGGLVGGLILGAGGMAVQWLVLVALYRLELRPQARPYFDLLRDAGVDMTSRAPVDQALKLFGQRIEEMEALLD